MRRVEVPIGGTELDVKINVNVGDLGQPIAKLVEFISQGIGTEFRPRAIRREAEAEAARQLMLACAAEEAKAVQLNGHLQRIAMLADDVQLVERAKARLLFQEIRGQLNVEAIAQQAIEHLPTEVGPEPASVDWRNRFLKYAADVSEADMQVLWAKLLAGELARPSTVSIRTLDILHTLGDKEAAQFNSLAELCFVDPVAGAPLISSIEDDLAPRGLGYWQLQELRDAGLVRDSEMTFAPRPGESLSLRYPQQFIVTITAKKSANAVVGFRYIPLTSAGRELVRVLRPTADLVHLQRVLRRYEVEHSILFLGSPDGLKEAYEQARAAPEA
jgi:hypothetical protein